MNDLEKLPNEMIVKILKKVPGKEQKKICTGSKKLIEICKDKYVQSKLKEVKYEKTYLFGKLHSFNDNSSLTDETQFGYIIKKWHKNGKLHRKNKPAEIWYPQFKYLNKKEVWYKNGEKLNNNSDPVFVTKRKYNFGKRK